ncbi:MAG: FecR domain-containing protein, partial [Pseudomonadales bacterium]|nr:FecR domain-containing protein [Pseudomonadales bacterium]
GLWLARMERGLSPDEKEEIERWLTESIAHGEALMELAYVWDDMAVLEELSDLFPLPLSGKKASGGWSWPAPRKISYALVGIFVVLASTFGLLQFGLQEPLSPTLAQPTTNPAFIDHGSSRIPDSYETAIGEQSKVNLPDGSVVTLNTDTRIRIHYSDTERQIILERGESYFEVAKDKTRPFVVHVDNNVIQAVGTAFNIDYSQLKNIEVTVTEGTIKLVTPKKLPQIILSGSLSEQSFISSGHSAIVAQAKAQLTTVTREEIATKLAWQQGMVIFEREPLKNALAELSRYTPVEFELADTAMEDILVGGYFKSGDIEGLLLALKENFNIDAKKDAGGRIILTAR